MNARWLMVTALTSSLLPSLAQPKPDRSSTSPGAQPVTEHLPPRFQLQTHSGAAHWRDRPPKPQSPNSEISVLPHSESPLQNPPQPINEPAPGASALNLSAVPRLAAVLRHRDWLSSRKFWPFNRVRYFTSRLERAHRAKADALRSLQQLGPLAAPALPELIELLAHTDLRLASLAEDAVVAVGRPSVPSLATALSNPEDPIRRRSASALARLGPSAKKAAPALLAALDDSIPEVRALAAKTFSLIAPASQPAFPKLIRLLADSEPLVRENAARALGAFGSAAAEAISPLAQTLTDSNETVRIQAANALGKIGPNAFLATARLIRALNDPSPIVRATSARTLGRIGPSAHPAALALGAHLQHDADPLVRNHCAVALGRIGPRARAAIPALVRALHDESRLLRLCAAEALGRMGAAAKPAIPQLMEAWRNDHAGMSQTVRASLHQIDPAWNDTSPLPPSPMSARSGNDVLLDPPGRNAVTGR